MCEKWKYNSNVNLKPEWVGFHPKGYTILESVRIGIGTAIVIGPK
jgi:hypothetical protein